MSLRLRTNTAGMVHVDCCINTQAKRGVDDDVCLCSPKVHPPVMIALHMLQPPSPSQLLSFNPGSCWLCQVGCQSLRAEKGSDYQAQDQESGLGTGSVQNQESVQERMLECFA